MAGEAPLFFHAAGPAPAGTAERVEGDKGLRLRAALFPARGPSRGSVVVSPGRTEPIEKYFETIGELTGRGFTALAHDWRGQGLSDRLLADRLAGHAVGFRPFMADFERLLDAFETRLDKPWIALGHSMGGCLTLLALARGERRFSAAILSAPMLGISTGATPRLAGRAMARALTAIGQGHRIIESRAVLAETFETNILTHDERRYERNQDLLEAHPDLALGAPTWGWLDFAFSAIAVLPRGAPNIDIPVTILAAGEERLVDNDCLRKVVARLPAGRLVEVPGAFHEILQETDEIRAVFWREFDALAAKVASAP